MTAWKLASRTPFDGDTAYRALSDAFRIGPARDMIERLADGRPVLVEGELPAADALRAAGIDVAAIEIAPLPERSRVASAAVSGAASRFEQVLSRLAPDAPAPFARPAWAEDIELFERCIARPLPDQLYAWLARHDGATMAIGNWTLEAAQRLEATWTLENEVQTGENDELAEPDPGVRKRWWHPAWIPFAADGAGNHLCIDLDPAPGGAVGQVIEFVHDHGERPRHAASLAAWLEAQACRLDDGRLVVLERDDGHFDGVLEAASLRDATLGVCRVRGESAADRRTRIERDLFADPGMLANLVIGLLRRDNRLRLVHGTHVPLVTVFAHELLAGDGSLAARLDRLIVGLPASRYVEHLDVRPSVLRAQLEALLD